MGGYRCLAAAWKLMLFHRSLQKRWKPLGASCGPLPPRLRGTRGGCVVGVIHPWGNTDPVSICVKIQTHHHFETRGPQSVSHHHDSAGRGNPLPHPILSNFFGGFFGNKYIYVFFFESCWWLWLSLQSRWQQIDKRRGRAHPQCWWAWQPSEMGHARHSCNNWPAEAKRRFRIITASFWYQLMFSSGNKPMTIADRWRLEIQKSPSTS